MNHHPDNDLPHDDEKVSDSVGTTVGEAVRDRRDGMMAGRPAAGSSDADQSLGEQSPHRVATLTEPASASRDALMDDQLGIVATSIRKRASKAGKASRNDAAERTKTMKKTSNGSLENRANPAPPPGTTQPNFA